MTAGGVFITPIIRFINIFRENKKLLLCFKGSGSAPKTFLIICPIHGCTFFIICPIHGCVRSLWSLDYMFYPCRAGWDPCYVVSAGIRHGSGIHASWVRPIPAIPRLLFTVPYVCELWLCLIPAGIHGCVRSTPRHWVLHICCFAETMFYSHAW